MRYFILLYLF